MPKTKRSSSSDSDSSDQNLEPSAKQSKQGTRTDDDEPTWVLQGTKLVKVRNFKGKVYVDIREYYEKGGKLLPGKKGISLTPSLWNKLLSKSEEINEAIISSG